MADFNLTPKQAKAYLILKDDIHKEIGYGGGAGGGKSILGCAWLIEMCINYPGTAWVMGRKELTNLKKTTLLSFFQTLQIMGVRPDTIFNMNNQTNIITFHNGSIIFLMDMSYQPSDPLYTRFGGLELTGAFVDESNENEVMAIEILKTRLGRRKNKEYGLIPKLLETFNPSKNHVYHRYYKPWKENKLDKHITFITALATDNPYLDKSYIEQLQNADKITRERLLYGNFEYDDDPTKIFEYERILDIFTNDYVLPTKHENYISCDVARFGDDLTVAIVWNGLWIKHIAIMAKSSIKQVKELLEILAHAHKVPRSNIIVDEDGVGGGVVDFMETVKGFVANSTPIENEYSKTIHNYANLKTQCYFKLAEIVNDARMGCYHDIKAEVKELIIEDLEQIAQKDIDKGQKIKLLTKEEIKEKLGRSTDLGDAMMLRMYFEVNPQIIPYVSMG